MKLNCKPGDLAMIVRRSLRNDPEEDAYLGAVLRVLSINGERTARWAHLGHTIWNTEPVSPILLAKPRLVLDYCLRPIRDPGEDATDESSAWLPPVPQKDKVAA